jgi:hypothetical protein
MMAAVRRIWSCGESAALPAVKSARSGEATGLPCHSASLRVQSPQRPSDPPLPCRPLSGTRLNNNTPGISGRLLT